MKTFAKLQSKVSNGKALILGNARTGNGPVTGFVFQVISVYLMISIGFLSFILGQVVNTVSQVSAQSNTLPPPALVRVLGSMSRAL